MTTRTRIVAEARTQMGVRWLHQGRLRGVALDCIGLLLVVGLALELPEAVAAANDPDLKAYGRLPNAAMLLSACDRYLDRVDLERMGLGDIPVMRFDQQPTHFGIISRVDPFHMIHTYTTIRKVVEHRIDALWTSRIVRAYRFRGIED